MGVSAKTAGKIKENLKKFGKFLKKGAIKIGVYSVAIFILILVVVFAIFITMNSKYVKTITNGSTSCIEADEFGSVGKVIQSRPISINDFIRLSETPRYEEFTERMYPTDLKLTLNGEPIIVNIEGKWTPWHMDNDMFEAPNESFVCLLEKNKLPDNMRYSNNDEENEFYYIKNFYTDISVSKDDKGNIKIRGLADAPERQKNCWVTRGAGLYLGVYGPKGRTEPSAFHHLIASKMICNTSNWFNKKNFDKNDLVLTKYYVPAKAGDEGAKKIKYEDMNGSLRTLYYDKSDIENSPEYMDLSARIKEITDTDIKNLEILKKEVEDKIKNETNNPTEEKVIIKNENGIEEEKTITSDEKLKQLNKEKIEIEDKIKKLESEKKEKEARLGKLKIDHYDYLYFIEKEYTMGDFKRSYFTLKNNSLGSEEILTNDGAQIIYDIDRHENLLYSNGFEKEAANIVATAISMFSKSCYSLEKNENGDTVRKYNAYYQYGPKTIYQNYSRAKIPYDFGDVIKMLIVDKYYSDNYGFYNIEIISGINFDDTGTVSGRLQEIEFYLLGTPKPGQNDDRADGLVAKVFNRLLSSGFATLVRIILGLYVVLFGYRILFGFKKNRNDREVVKMSDMMLDLFKLCLIIGIISPSGFQLFSRIVLNFTINGVVGFVDLIAGIFPNNFSSDGAIALTGGLKSANEVVSLSRHFGVIDEVLALVFGSNVVNLKILSLFFNTGGNFFLGIPVGMGVFVIVLLYAYKLTIVALPFIFTLLQLTLVLPLAPLFLLFNFFEQTKYIFKNWLNFILGKCLETIAFFTGFYFSTFIITNLVKKLLHFKVCFHRLGDYYYGIIKGMNLDELNWIQSVIRSALNCALYMQKSGLPNNFFIYYLINISLSFIMLSMFEGLTQTIMNIIGRMFVIGEASTGSIGEGGTLSQFNNSKVFGAIGNQMFVDFNDTMGLATLQETAFPESKKLFDLRRPLTGKVRDAQGRVLSSNLSMIGEQVKEGLGTMPGAVTDALTSDTSLRDAYNKRVSEFMTKKTMLGEFNENTFFDFHTRNVGKHYNYKNRDPKVINEEDSKIKKFFKKGYNNLISSHDRKVMGDEYNISKRKAEIMFAEEDAKRIYNANETELNKLLDDDKITRKEFDLARELMRGSEDSINKFKYVGTGKNRKALNHVAKELEEEKKRKEEEEKRIKEEEEKKKEGETSATNLTDEDATVLSDEKGEILSDEKGEILSDQKGEILFDATKEEQNKEEKNKSTNIHGRNTKNSQKRGKATVEKATEEDKS